MKAYTITTPDDFHVHLRDGAALPHTVKATAQHYARALVMPNLTLPLTDVAAVEHYRQRIMQAHDQSPAFTPLMCLYLHSSLTFDALQAAKQHAILALKWYPKGATTHSEAGIAEAESVYPLLELMQELDLLLLIHGESKHPEHDIFSREQHFIDETLRRIRRDFPRLRMVLEHISTAYAVEFVRQAGARTAATITPQHILLNRNHLLSNGLKPHYYCMPILKEERDRRAVLEAAISGSPQFFLGSDSAPHARSAKESSCGCAGCYSAAYSLSYYAEAFEQADALARLEDFSSRFGAEFYGLPRNSGEVVLEKRPFVVPESLPYADGETLVPLMAGQTLQWQAYRLDAAQ